MTRTIILIPIGKCIGLTTISLSMISMFEKVSKRVLFFNPFFEYFNFNKKIDDTSFIIHKYFLTSCVTSINVNKKDFLFNQFTEKDCLENSIDTYFSYKNSYDIILIEGIKHRIHEYAIHDFNLRLANLLHAELIFIFSDNFHYVQWCINQKNILQEYLNIKNNILGVIINNIFFDSKKIYIQNFFKPPIIKSSNKNLIKKTIFFPIIASIPWNQDLVCLPVYKIFQNLKVKLITQHHQHVHLITSFMLYNDSILKEKKNYFSTILIIPWTVFLQKYKKISFKIFNYFTFNSILFTDIDNIYMLQKHTLIQYLKKKTAIFSTILDIKIILFILKNFNISILDKNKMQIQQSKKYMLKFINKDYCFSGHKITKNMHVLTISPVVFCNNLKEYAKKINKCILLPEGYEPRIIKSASIVTDLGIARCILLGNPDKIHKISFSLGITLSKNVTIIDPHCIRYDYITHLLKLRVLQGMTEEIARSNLHNNMVLGSVMLHKGEVDGIVCGVKYTTADVLRSAFQLIGTHNFNNNKSIVSSVFFMLLKDRVLVYGDCAININPNAKQLSEIAIQSADLSKMFGIIPRIAMLSYSTGSSGSGEMVEKVKEATLFVREKRPDLIVEGPIQYDAAVNPLISNIKIPLSSLSGQATVFIFPDLNSGNIAYKAVQQSSNIIAIGPILQGLIKPINDLSRGSSLDDIVYTIAITSIQAHYVNKLHI